MWTPEAIRLKLETFQPDDKGNHLLGRAVLAIYHRQLEDEKSYQETAHNNGVGFNKPDAKQLSKMAQWYEAKKFLTRKQVLKFKVQTRILKYSKQLADIANQKAASKGAV